MTKQQAYQINTGGKKVNWKKAEEHLTEIRLEYTKIGKMGIPALNIFINPLLIRFENGERTQDLYDKIMELE